MPPQQELAVCFGVLAVNSRWVRHVHVAHELSKAHFSGARIQRLLTATSGHSWKAAVLRGHVADSQPFYWILGIALTHQSTTSCGGTVRITQPGLPEKREVSERDTPLLDFLRFCRHTLH
jgi:hypothetical protein